MKDVFGIESESKFALKISPVVQGMTLSDSPPEETIPGDDDNGQLLAMESR